MIEEKKIGLWDRIHAKRERIKRGSGEHMRRPGSTGAPSASDLKETQICETADAGLAVKASKSGISIGTLRKVYRRGVAAWNSGHRPGTTPQQWGMARVNSYIGKGSGTYHGADKDLRQEEKLDEKKLPEVPKDKESGLPKKYVAGLSDSTAKARAAHFAKADKLSDRDPEAYKPAPGDATAKTKPSKHTLKYRAMFGKERPTQSDFRAAATEAVINFKTAETTERQSKDPANPNSRFDGTTQGANTFRKETPGQIVERVVKRVVKEAAYQGREVPLNKPMKGDVKKSKVYVKDPQTGNVKKVNFGSKEMSIKKDQPANKKSYCARSSGQGNLTKKTSANYWSRRAWDCN